MKKKKKNTVEERNARKNELSSITLIPVILSSVVVLSSGWQLHCHRHRRRAPPNLMCGFHSIADYPRSAQAFLSHQVLKRDLKRTIWALFFFRGTTTLFYMRCCVCCHCRQWHYDLFIKFNPARFKKFHPHTDFALLLMIHVCAAIS